MVWRHESESLLSSTLVIRVSKGVTCRTSLIESHQGCWEKAGGVGSDTRDVVGTADSKCGYMRLTVYSTPFSSTKHRDVLHNGHHLYISCLSSWKGFRPHSAWSHCWVLQSFGLIKWFKSLCDMFTYIIYACMYSIFSPFTVGETYPQSMDGSL